MSPRDMLASQGSLTMPDRRTDWTALLAAIAAVLVTAAATCLLLVQCGCAATKGSAAGVNAGQQVTAERVELMEEAVVNLSRKLEIQAGVRQDATGGRDVTINDPWPLRLLLGGIPASFIAYLLSKRVAAIRKVYDALSGKPCAERQAGRCIPSVWMEAGSTLEGLAAQHRTDVDEFHVKHGPQDDQG